MQAQYWWWLIALCLGIAEMFTGTFYLLVLAIGCLAGGLAALAVASAPAQMVVAAIASLLAWAALRKLMRERRGAQASAQANRDVLLDIGERVRVDSWDEHGRGFAHYRGARWQVELERQDGQGWASEPARPGDYQIRRLAGNTLVVAPLP
ncbi:MAG: NfeD family protein [Burkholderiaceae bacterium]